MKKDINIILKQIVDRKAREFSLEKEKRNHTGSVVSIFQEEWHLYAWLNHPLVPTLEIQISINIEREMIRILWFPHPVLITNDTMGEYIRFCNEVNRELYTGGRFWCDEENYDFAYEIVLKEEIIEKCVDEAARLLFDVPYSHFQDIHIPLIMLKNGTWQSETAIKYIKELRTKGVVDNSDYNLW